MWTVRAAIGEEAATIEDVYEPFLLQLGLLQKSQDAVSPIWAMNN